MLRNTSSAGPQSAVVPFGTGSEREKKTKHFHDFCRAIGREVSKLAAREQLPLVVAATHEESSMYVAVATTPWLAPKTIDLSPDGGVSGTILNERALDAALSWQPAELARALTRARGQAGGPGSERDPERIATLAAEGRIRDLLIDESVYDRLEEINRAAIATLRGGGQVWMADKDAMTGLGSLIAALRY
jgi:hypothetical protein